jgi:hypothetical protein
VDVDIITWLTMHLTKAVGANIRIVWGMGLISRKPSLYSNNQLDLIKQGYNNQGFEEW